MPMNGEKFLPRPVNWPDLGSQVLTGVCTSAARPILVGSTSMRELLLSIIWPTPATKLLPRFPPSFIDPGYSHRRPKLNVRLGRGLNTSVAYRAMGTRDHSRNVSSVPVARLPLLGWPIANAFQLGNEIDPR